MNWFEEQLQQRKQTDNERFSDALDSIAGAVMGQRLAEALDSDETADNAIDEILKFYHCKTGKDSVPAYLTETEDRIEYRMRPYGIMRRRVELDSGWYRNAAGAMLGTLKEDGSAVALLPGKFSGYYFLNFKTGQKIRLNARTENLLDREAMCFYRPLPLRAVNVKDLLVFMMQQISVSDAVMFFVAMAAVTLLGLLSPLFTKWLFGEVLKSGKGSVLVSLAVFMLFFSLSRLCISAFQNLLNARISAKQNIAVQAAVMNRVMSFPANFFREYSSGELYRRAAYVQSLCSIMMNSVGTVGLSSLFSLVYIAQIFAFAPALVTPSLIIIIATMTVSIITTFTQVRITRERMLRGTKTDGVAYSTITGIQKIKLAGAEKRMFSRWAETYAREASLTYNPPAFLKLSATLSLAISLVGTLVIYSVAAKTGVSMEDYYAFNTAYGMVSGAFMSLVSVASTFAGIRPTLDMAKPILETAPELTEGSEMVTSLNGAIELVGVSFRYDERMPYVIDNLSLKIKKGEYLAVTGATGCGKSTLLRLLLGFEKPEKGTIFYDNRDMSRMDMRSLRRNIGTVMQDGKLFQGDIFSNIIISAPQLTLDDAWEAARIASVDEEIEQMPMGMNTYITEGQGGISGGQKQRLMIARAVAPRPKILMFDEATSALDNITQKKVSEAIDKLDCTRIVIAHRLSTIKNADRIVYLEGGKIAEEGTYEELIALDGKFSELVRRQRLDVEVD